MATAEAWQRAEIGGPTKAFVIPKPDVLVAMIKRAKRPILIAGHRTVEVPEGEPYIDTIIRIAKAGNIPVVATAHIVGEFVKRGLQPSSFMPAVDITARLQDPSWNGLDGKGQYDIAIYTGIPFYMEWLLLSGLKHFATHLKTVALDRFYQPQASWSFGNPSLKDWKTYLETIANQLEVK
jgi:acetyl-CoA decarbonylase/synthase complex subunit epsilon